EDTSVIRKFSVLFSLMSFLPFIILAVLFFYFIKGGAELNLNLIFWSAFLVGIFALVGFFLMRRTLVNLIKISEGTKDILKGGIPDRIDINAAGDNEVGQIARAFNEIVQRLEVNIQELQKSKNLLQDVLTKIASGVSSAENIDAFLDLILETTVGALGAKTGLLLLCDDEERKELTVKSSFGPGANFYSKGQRIPADTGAAGWVVKQKESLIVPRVHKEEPSKIEGADLAFRPPLISTALVFQNKVVGVISISGKKADGNFQEDELIILSNLASQIALAIENAKLNHDAQKTYLETITALALAVEARDPYSRGHSDRVSKYAMKIAQKLGLGEEKIKRIREAAMLHDVGKIGISDEILKKPDSLNEDEEKIMQQHPIIGEGIIIPLRGFSQLRDPIRHHHERVNGEGYPDGLKDNEISPEAKILSVADAFDAITTERPYRKGLDFNQAKQELIRYKGIHYDPKVVDVLLECI
ncbi:MAG: HD domain-containing phosphohydrolase, partial [Candidatus Omnitrophota bacterium]